MHEQGGWTFQYDVELERPLELIPGKTYSMEIYIDESVMEVYVGGTTGSSVCARMTCTTGSLVLLYLTERCALKIFN